MTNCELDGPRLGEDLLAWYAKHGRDLPWRGTKDPYAIWVSEIILHQTRVSTGLSYYAAFLERFPTVEELAAAPLDDVLKVWEGLGYYARARNLHRAAQLVVLEHGGRLPEEFDQLVALPGIGAYTASAIASIVYGQDRAAVDGNIKRVISRLCAMKGDIASAATIRRITEIAQSLLPMGRAAEFNQASMDLGAAICLPKRPRCLVCPVGQHCQARARGLQNEIPVRAGRRKVPHYQVAAGVIWNEEHSEQFLVARRRLEDMLGGLWEFPGGKQEDDETLEECLRRELLEELGVDVRVGAKLVVVDHAYTHFRITLHAFHCWIASGEPQAIEVDGWRWISLDQVAELAFSRADHKVISALREVAAHGAAPPEPPHGTG